MDVARPVLKLGVLGGTFDPVHTGHLVVAEEVRARLNLDRVLFVPAGNPYLKTDTTVSSTEDRLEMVRRAIAGKTHLELSTIDIERPGPSYTVDTIAGLRGQLGDGHEFYFILGWDNLNQLPRWHDPTRLVALCFLVAVARVGYPVPDLDELAAVVPGLKGRVILLDRPRIDISASVIRERVARGLSIHSLVPPAVAAYIREHRLYLSPG